MSGSKLREWFDEVFLPSGYYLVFLPRGLSGFPSKWLCGGASRPSSADVPLAGSHQASLAVASIAETAFADPRFSFQVVIC